jgi:hypothetical protein
MKKLVDAKQTTFLQVPHSAPLQILSQKRKALPKEHPPEKTILFEDLGFLPYNHRPSAPHVDGKRLLKADNYLPKANLPIQHSQLLIHPSMKCHQQRCSIHLHTGCLQQTPMHSADVNPKKGDRAAK